MRLDIKRRNTAKVTVSEMIIVKKKKESGSFLIYVYKDAGFPVSPGLRLDG